MGLWTDLAALAISFFGAGIALGLAAIPERLELSTRLFLSSALAVPATLLVSVPGFATHSLARWNLIAVLVLLVAVAIWRRRGARESGPNLFPARRPTRRQLAYLAVAAVVTWLAVFVPQGVNEVGNGRPNGTIVYYHWGIVGKVAADDGIPATLPAWGEPREFPYEYTFSVMHAASTATLAGGADFFLEERYRIAMVAAAFFAALALWRRWLPWWWAWLAAVLTLNVSRIETRMLVYKPEAFAFILVLWSTWLLDEALERRSPRWGSLAGLVLACSFLAHPVGSLLVGPLWGGVLLGRLLPYLYRRRRQRPPREPLAGRRDVVDAARVVLPTLVVFAVLFVGVRAVVGTTGQNLQQRPVNGVDETRVVYNLAYVSDDPLAHPSVPEASHPFSVYSSVRPFYARHARWFFFDAHELSSVLLIVGAVVFLVAAFLLHRPAGLSYWPRSAVRGVLTLVFYAVGVILLALLIGVVYHTWVPERVGPMRLMPYWALVFPGLLAGLAWVASIILSSVLSRVHATARLGTDRSVFGGFAAPGPTVRGVMVVPAVLVSALVLWTFTTGFGGRDRGVPPFFIPDPRAGGVSTRALDAYAWMHGHLPEDAVILANGYTEGALGMVSGRTGLLDGRTPFSQPDPWRSDAIRWLEQARRYFREPATSPLPPRADYVLAAPGSVNLGGSYFPTDFDQLARAPGLAVVHRFGPLTLYRVVGRTR